MLDLSWCSKASTVKQNSKSFIQFRLLQVLMSVNIYHHFGNDLSRTSKKLDSNNAPY